MEERTIHLKTRGEFKNILEKYEYIIVKLTASWCDPCKKSTPLFNNYFKQLPEKYICVIVDIDIVSKNMFDCSSIPTFINYIKGEKQDIQVGSDPDKIKNFFVKSLQRTL